MTRRTKLLTATLLLGTAVGGAVGVSSAGAIEAAVGKAGGTVSPAIVKTPTAFAPGRPGSLADMVQAVGPAVVQIKASADGGRSIEGHGALPLKELFGDRTMPRGPARATLGSGFVIDPAGTIVTNNHVVDGASRVTVTFGDGREFSARVLGRDPKTDLAVVRIEGDGRFPAIGWGDSDAVRVGEDVFAVGSPFGLGNSVTSGILSARGREIGTGPYDDFLQVDAPINSGNSGGPLFNAAGQVIGVNTAIFSPSGGNVGIGFAIPSRMAQSVVRQIVADGHVSRGRIGVLLQPLTSEIAETMRLRSTEGALIAEVEPGGPAARAGLASGDVVTAFAGRPIEDSRALARAVAEAKPGSRVPVNVQRGRGSGVVQLAVEATHEG